MLKAKQKLISVFLALAMLFATAILGFSSLFGAPKTVNAETTGSYVKVTTAPADWSGTYLIVYEDGTNAYVFNGKDAVNGYISATIANETIAYSSGLEAVQVTIEAMSGGYAIKSSSGYIYGTSGSNKLNFNASTQQLNTIALETDGVTIISNTSVLRFNATSNQMRFRYFKSSSSAGQKAICLYKYEETTGDEGGDSSVEDSSSEISVCEHANTITNTMDATCTEAGSIVVTCDDCGETISTEEIPAAGHNYVDGTCSVCGEQEPSSDSTEVSFNLGDNGATGHTDGTEKTSYTETNDDYDYTLSITGGTKMYIDARDEKGNSCIKLGTSSVAGGFSFTVPSDVTSVAIYIAKYKEKTSKVTVNGTAYTLTNSSNDGAYDEIIVDTTTIKTVSLTTVSGGYRAMVNTITYVIDKSMADCAHETTELHNNENGTHILICAACGQPQSELETCTAEIFGAPISNDDRTHTQTGTCICGATITKTEGCSFDEGIVTAPTQTEQGYTTYTCENCSYSYQDDFIPALGATTYTFSFSENGTITTTEILEKDTLYPLPSVSAQEPYSFFGWTTEKYKEDSEIYEAGTEYSVTKDQTFYALYKISTYNLVSDASALAIGDNIIIAANNDNYALSTNQKSSNRGAAAITKTNDTVTFGDDVQIITLEAGTTDGTFAFNVGTGYLYAASSSSNQLKTKASLDANGSWKISISEGITSIVAQGTNTRNVMQYNFNNGSPLFNCYSSASQTAISLYKEQSFYTDSFANIDSASLTIGEDITMNYYVDMSEAFADAKLQYVINNQDVEIESTFDGSRYKFSFQVPPHYMAETITTKLVCNGLELDSEEYSVQTYAQNILSDVNSSDTLKQFVSDMLRYGAAAQNYKGHNTANLATSGVDGLSDEREETPPEVEATPVNASGVDFGAWFTSATVYFADVNTIRVKINTTENVTMTINGTPVEVTGTTIETQGILPTAFAQEFVFELSYNNQVMQTLTYSVNAYAYKIQQNSKAKPEMKALALALYRYGLSATAYNS